MAKFRKLDISISRASGYGHYILQCNYKGKYVKVGTTNSECYDWLEDSSVKEMNTETKRYAYRAIVRAYDNMC